MKYLPYIALVILFPIMIFGKSLIMTDEKVKDYFITCDSDSFEYIYKNYKIDHYICVSLTHNGKTWKNVRMRIRGDSSREYPKKSLKLKFDGAKFSNGRDALNFNAEYLDVSYLHSIITSRLMRDSGHYCFNAEPARLYINGEFLGLYIRIENVDEDFLSSSNLDPEGNLYKATLDGACLSIYDDVNHHWEKKTNKDTGRDDLKNLILNINNVPDPEYYDFTSEYFDYEKMINIIAMNMLLANGSTYYHNYYMYHDINNTKKWIMLPWDVDRTLSTYGLNYPYHRSSKLWTANNPMLERAIICEPIFNAIKNRIDELSRTIFNLTYVSPIIDSLQTILAASVAQDTTDKITDTTYWKIRLGHEKTFIKNRVARLNIQFDNWPGSFRVYKTPDIFTNSVTLKWNPAVDPNGDTVTYTIKYSQTKTFIDSQTITLDGIVDTIYTLPNTPADGIYYWYISATDGVNSIDGFDTRNTFTVKKATKLPLEITENIVLTKANSPYLAEGDVTIASWASLSVESGVEIRMSESAGINVYGEIHFFGTANEPIRLRADLNASRWGALNINNAMVNSSISHVLIENASFNKADSVQSAAINSYSSNIILDNVRFANNIRGIFTREGNIIVRNCTFENNNLEANLTIQSASVLVEDCTFYGISRGFLINLHGIEDGIFRQNTIWRSPAGGIYLDNGCSNFLISQNFIYDCRGPGISVNNKSDAIIEKNVVCGAITGLEVTDSYSYLNHNTFYSNNIAVSCYEKAAESGGGSVEIINTIISNSVVSALSTDELSISTASYSLADTEVLPGKGNLMADPEFISTENRNFNLRSTSPCIDAGNPESPLDPDGTRTDIGAFFFDSNCLKLIVINEINYNSSDNFDPEDWVEFYNSQDTVVNISGWYFKDEKEDHIFTFPEATKIAPGDYLVLCRDTSSFSLLFPDVSNFTGDMDFGLSSKGELIRIFNTIGTVVDSVRYDNNEPWPAEPDGNGPTLELLNPAYDNSLSCNWASSTDFGTPGRRNSVFIDTTTQPTQELSFILYQNYPNPFNSTTKIIFFLPETGSVELKIYNINGQLVQSIKRYFSMKGINSFIWNENNKSSGIYFYQISVNGKRSATKKAILLK